MHADTLDGMDRPVDQAYFMSNSAIAFAPCEKAWHAVLPANDEGWGTRNTLQGFVDAPVEAAQPLAACPEPDAAEEKEEIEQEEQAVRCSFYYVPGGNGFSNSPQRFLSHARLCSRVEVPCLTRNVIRLSAITVT
jgi:hypothetical protein